MRRSLIILHRVLLLHRVSEVAPWDGSISLTACTWKHRVSWVGGGIFKTIFYMVALIYQDSQSNIPLTSDWWVRIKLTPAEWSELQLFSETFPSLYFNFLGFFISRQTRQYVGPCLLYSHPVIVGAACTYSTWSEITTDVHHLSLIMKCYHVHYKNRKWNRCINLPNGTFSTASINHLIGIGWSYLYFVAAAVLHSLAL